MFSILLHFQTVEELLKTSYGGEIRAEYQTFGFLAGTTQDDLALAIVKAEFTSYDHT